MAVALVALGLTLVVAPGFTVRADWLIAALAILIALGSLAAAWRLGRKFDRSFHEVGAAVSVASQRLGRELSHHGSVVSQLRALVDEIDRLIEDRRQREREVMRADQLAMVGQIAAGVAHELRNPLTSVKMLVQTNLRDPGKFASEDLEVIEQEIRRMERCLQRFLDFARPPQPESRPVSLAELVEQTFALVDGRAHRQRISLRFVRPTVPVVAQADEDQIRQLIVNLVLNALDAMPDGGTIEIQLAEHEPDIAELLVLDSGPGIPESLFPTLFDPFVSTKETGIGLGLAVSHRIATGHGGNLTAVNRPEGGACFRLRLPASKPSSAIS